MGEEEHAAEDGDETGVETSAGHRPSAIWPAIRSMLIGVLALLVFSTGLGVAISRNEAGTSAAQPKPQVLGQQFVREPTTTTTLDAPLSGGRVTVRIDRAATTTTRPPRTTTTRPATVTTSPRTATAPPATAPQTLTAPQTATTTGTLPPRLECGTGSALGAVNVDITPIRDTQTWTVVGTIVVTNGVSKPIAIDALTLQIGRELTTTQDAPIAGVAGAVINPGEAKSFAVNVETDARPVTVHIGQLSYHVAGIPACAVA